jgi:outer membrane protein assembly factor BamB
MERYAVPPERVGSELIDDETLVIDFVSSAYYCLNPTASLVWEMVTTAPHSVDEITNALAAVHAVSPSDVRADVASLVQALVDERVLDATDGDAAPPGVDIAPRGAYLVPCFEKFGSLDQLMLAGE